MKNGSRTISIDPDALVDRLREIETSAEGDIARVIELLLIENHILRRQRSTGLMRGAGMQFNTYPRFLRFDDAATRAASAEFEEEDGRSRT